MYLKPDSALGRCNKPFFVPEELGNIVCEASVVVRICRLGKSIPQRFANRYYDALTVGVDFTAHDLLKKACSEGLPWDAAKAMDGSAVIGEWLPIEKVKGLMGEKASIEEESEEDGVHFLLERNGLTVQEGFTADMLWNVDALIAYCSQYITLKTGDLLFTGTPSEAVTVNVGDMLTGYLEGCKVMELRAR